MQLVISALPGNTPETPMITLEYYTSRLRRGPRYYDANLRNRATARLLLTFRLQPPNILATLVVPALLLCLTPRQRLMMKHCHLIACYERGHMGYSPPTKHTQMRDLRSRASCLPLRCKYDDPLCVCPRRPLARDVIPNSSGITFRRFDHLTRTLGERREGFAP